MGETLQMQWRAHGIQVECVIEEVTDSYLRFRTSTPIRGVAAGQQAVFYEGDIVIGSATINDSTRID
jgi:tRNA-specific 2-thiouridylase